jgi:hypothetical protein
VTNKIKHSATRIDVSENLSPLIDTQGELFMFSVHLPSATSFGVFGLVSLAFWQDIVRICLMDGPLIFWITQYENGY